MHDSIATIDQVKNTLIDLAIRFGPRLAAALLILFAGVLVSRYVTRWTTRGLSRIELEPPIRIQLSRVAWLLSMALFIILALENLAWSSYPSSPAWESPAPGSHWRCRAF